MQLIHVSRTFDLAGQTAQDVAMLIAAEEQLDMIGVAESFLGRAAMDAPDIELPHFHRAGMDLANQIDRLPERLYSIAALYMASPGLHEILRVACQRLGRDPLRLDVDAITSLRTVDVLILAIQRELALEHRDSLDRDSVVLAEEVPLFPLVLP